VLDRSGTFSKSTQVTGNLYAASYTSPTPSTLTTAIFDMQTAYTDASGRILPNFLNLGSGKFF
jgi:Ice-binding-like